MPKAKILLIGIGFAGSDHSNIVVRELKVRTRYLVFRHVAGDAQLLPNPASAHHACRAGADLQVCVVASLRDIGPQT